MIHYLLLEIFFPPFDSILTLNFFFGAIKLIFLLFKDCKEKIFFVSKQKKFSGQIEVDQISVSWWYKSCGNGGNDEKR